MSGLLCSQLYILERITETGRYIRYIGCRKICSFSYLVLITKEDYRPWKSIEIYLKGYALKMRCTYLIGINIVIR